VHPMKEMATPDVPRELPREILLYDGVCGLCDRIVQWMLDHEGDQRLMYTPLQGETAARLRALHPEIPTELSTVVYIADGRVHLRSRAILNAARHLRGRWRWLYKLRWLPAFLLDLGYWVVARVRYRIWGQLDSCRMPTPEERSRFLS